MRIPYGFILTSDGVLKINKDEADAVSYTHLDVYKRQGHHHPLYAIRFDYKFFTFLAKVLPARFLNWLIYCCLLYTSRCV